MQNIINAYYEIWFNTNAIYEEWAKTRGISYNALLIIHYIYENKEITLSGLCAKTFLPKQTVSSILDNFESKGDIRKITSDSDCRRRIISLTTEGYEYAAKILGELRYVEEKTLKAMSIADQAAYIRTGRMFIDEFRRNLQGDK